jgi:hypothetical protein
VPLAPGSPVMAFIATNFDDPSLVGVALAFSVAGGLATGRRATQADVGEQSSRSA